ncbi:tetratricopeptide repeat protein 14 homolog isoform X2 [Leptopilina boulardi]|uniref:tetratricopeptide repeat protein 14 homolog isoform X2 n=1 Tax=Leptopilina boulardi TaxID=63433 RepID=UPI0021F682F9|nr:tetratricopeptide repeat protein 14 homolog isoform X2 [Leptopilina boulardi]
MDSLDAVLIEQALNYHGEQLQKVWEDRRGKDELSMLFDEKLSFEVYEQREKTLCENDNEKRQRLQKFIAKKADVLYSKSNSENSTVPISQQIDHEAYGTMPGLDSFIKIDKSQRVRNFLESLVNGDVIYTQVLGKSSMGFLLKVLCNCSDCPRVVPELTIKALMLNSSTLPAVDKNGVTREYMVDDLVCVCVSEVNIEAERIIASMNITPRKGLISHPPLGLIDANDLPDIYRRIAESNDEIFESILENSPGFCNPNNTKYLSDLLLLGQDNHSHMIGLREGFSLDEYGVKLRQIQSSKWAFRYVTDGIDHFQEGKNSEAFKCLNKALLIDPLNEEGLVARGCLHTTNGNLNKAVEDFEMAIKLNQSHVSARKYLVETLVALGRNYEDEKEFDKALEVFNKCLTIDPCHEIAKNEIEYLKLGGMNEENENSVHLLNNMENHVESSIIKLDKKKQKRRKLMRKKRKRCSSTSSSSSSDSSQSESSTSSSSSESRSSSSSSSHRKSLDSKTRASLSPLSKRMSMYNILPEINNDLLDLECPRDNIGSDDDTKDYELKVRKFLDKSKDDSDYEDKVRIFFKTAARWKMEREEEKKQNNEKIKRKGRKSKKDRAKDERREKLFRKEERKKYKSRKRRLENNGMSPLQDLQKVNISHDFANQEEESQLFYHDSRISPQSTSTSSEKFKNAKLARHKNEINKVWDDFSIDSNIGGGKHKNNQYESELNNSSNAQKQMRNHQSQSPLREKIVPKQKIYDNKSNSKSIDSPQNNFTENNQSPEIILQRRISEERYFKRLRSQSCNSSSSSSSRFRLARRSRSRSFSLRSRKSASFERKYSRSISRSYSRSPPKYRSKSFSRSRSQSEERKYRYKQQPTSYPSSSRGFNNRGGRYNSRYQGHNSNYRGSFQNGNRFHNGQDNRFNNNNNNNNNNRRGMQYNKYNPNYRGRGQNRGRFFHNNRQQNYRKHFPQDGRQSFSQEKEFYPQERNSYSQDSFAQKKHFYSQDMPPNSRKFNQTFNSGEENQEGGF